MKPSRQPALGGSFFGPVRLPGPLALCAGIGFFAAHSEAQRIALSGKVTDGAGTAVGGAVVTLKSKYDSDTTDATGAYAFNLIVDGLRGPRALSGIGTVAYQAGTLSLELARSERIRLEKFDVRGNRLGKPWQRVLESGSHRLRPEFENSAGVALIRVSLAGQSIDFLLAPVPGIAGNGPASTHSAPSSSAPLAKSRASQAVNDTLEAKALGYKTKSVPITTYEGEVNIALESEFTGTCIASQSVNSNARGSGPHSVVVETNSADGIKAGTIFRPADLGPGKKYPIVSWGEGACALNGLDNSASMAEIASHGYFVIADGTPNGTGSRPMNANDLDAMGAPMIAYIDWIIGENRKPCSPYYQSIDTSKIGTNGFSCGGLLSMGTAKDPRLTTWGLTSSGSFNNNPTLWNAVHTPVLIIQGHQDNTGAYTNGKRDYNGIAPLGHPILFMSHKNQGHGGDLWSANGGHFTKIHLAWLNWWLKGDTGATGKGALVGSGCSYCSDNNWEVLSDNLP